MLHNQTESFIVWVAMAICVAQSAIFSGLNLAVFSVSKLRLEVEAANGSKDARRVLGLRKDSNFTLATIVWGNVAVNVLLPLLSNSVLAGVSAFALSTFIITIFGEILPQAYSSRNALRFAARMTPVVTVYQTVLFPIAKPTSMLLNWWLGEECIKPLREEDFRVLISRHFEFAGGDMSRLEGTGALNFLDLDDILVVDEGEPVDPRSVIALATVNGLPDIPAFERSPTDPFLRRLNAAGRKWVIITDEVGEPYWAVDVHHFLRDVLFDQTEVKLDRYWHRPIMVRDGGTRLGEVIGRLCVKPERSGDDVIDVDLILLWSEHKRIITGADLLGRLLRGIAVVDVRGSRE